MKPESWRRKAAKRQNRRAGGEKQQNDENGEPEKKSDKTRETGAQEEYGIEDQTVGTIRA